MIDNFINVIGRNYSPIVTELSDGSIDVSTDWGYIFCCILLLLAFYGAFKALARFVFGDRR